MQGNLSQINFTDLLLLATGGKKSGVLKLNHGKEAVEIFFTSGNIVHANCPIGDGEKALLYPITWDEGTFSLLPDGTASRTSVSKSSVDILDEVKNMTREWQIILAVIPSAKTVFRLAELTEDNTGPVTVPNVGWRVLSKLDGIRSVQDVAELLRIPFAYAAKVIYSLHKSGLVALTPVAKPAAELVPAALLSRVTNILTDMIGPMAPLVLRDQIESLGESSNSLPESKLHELIRLLGREFSDSKLKSQFEESMVQEIANFRRF
jgi:hypothetical protein